MAKPEEKAYNKGKLMECGADESVAEGTAQAIEKHFT